METIVKNPQKFPKFPPKILLRACTPARPCATPRDHYTKKHDPGKIPGTRTMCSRISEKKWGNPPPPADGPAGGGHFFSDFGDRVGWVPLGCKVLKKSVTYPMGVSSEATRRVYLGTRDTVRTK